MQRHSDHRQPKIWYRSLHLQTTREFQQEWARCWRSARLKPRHRIYTSRAWFGAWCAFDILEIGGLFEWLLWSHISTGWKWTWVLLPESWTLLANPLPITTTVFLMLSSSSNNMFMGYRIYFKVGTSLAREVDSTQSLLLLCSSCRSTSSMHHTISYYTKKTTKSEELKYLGCIRK